MDIDVVMKGNLSDPQIEALASALSRNGFAANKEEIRSAVTGDEVKTLLQRRGEGFHKDKIARLLNNQQKAKFEQLLKEVKLKT